jgi:glycosyltransferase involved in cell wall biosynthesis
MPLRVLHVIGGGDTGGAMSYLLPLLTALRRQGCDARLLCLGGGGLAEAAAARSLPSTVIPMRHPWDVRALAPLRRHLALGPWQVVHTHGMRANLPVRLALPGIRPAPLLFTTVHSDLALDYPDAVRARGYALLDRATRWRVDGFCCVSAALARHLVAGGLPEQHVHVVHPGVELPDGTGSGETRPASGADAAARRPTIGTVARLVPVKDLGLLLDAVALVAQQFPEVRAAIVGDGPERALLEERAGAADLRGRVEFPGLVMPAWPALAGFDVFASSSESEGIPISVLEAMAAGLPVVAPAVGGLPETVTDGMTGFLVERTSDRAATAAALAEAICRLLGDEPLRRRMGRAGAERVAEYFSAEVTGSRMLAIYEKTIAGAEARRRRDAPAPRANRRPG